MRIHNVLSQMYNYLLKFKISIISIFNYYHQMNTLIHYIFFNQANDNLDPELRETKFKNLTLQELNIKK